VTNKQHTVCLFSIRGACIKQDTPYSLNMMLDVHFHSEGNISLRSSRKLALLSTERQFSAKNEKYSFHRKRKLPKT